MQPTHAPLSPAPGPAARAPTPTPGEGMLTRAWRDWPSGSRGSTPSRLLRPLLLLRSREPEVERHVSASQGESL